MSDPYAWTERSWTSRECAAEGCKRISFTKHGYCKACRLKQPDFKALPPRSTKCIVCQKTLSSERVRYCGPRCAARMANAKFTYKLTEQQVLELLARTHCDACAEPFAEGEPRHIDHCHATGQVRGSLHGRCNTGIGNAGEDIERLHHWGEYLASHQLDLRDSCVTT